MYNRVSFHHLKPEVSQAAGQYILDKTRAESLVLATMTIMRPAAPYCLGTAQKTRWDNPGMGGGGGPAARQGF